MTRHLAPAGPLRVVLAGALAMALGVALGAALGWVSGRFWVIGLFGVVAGLGLGWALAVATLWLGRIPGVRAVTVLALFASWLTLQVFEDHHLLVENRAHFAALNLKRLDELSPAEMARIEQAGGPEFLAGDSDARLEEQVVKAVGFGGPVGRWVFRGQGGVRLAGTLQDGRALPVGIVGFVVATLLEIGLAAFLALRIVRRATAPGGPALDAGNTGNAGNAGDAGLR